MCCGGGTFVPVELNATDGFKSVPHNATHTETNRQSNRIPIVTIGAMAQATNIV